MCFNSILHIPLSCYTTPAGLSSALFRPAPGLRILVILLLCSVARLSSAEANFATPKAIMFQAEPVTRFTNAIHVPALWLRCHIKRNVASHPDTTQR